MSEFQFTVYCPPLCITNLSRATKMSQPLQLSTDLYRSLSAVSVAASDTTFHSFNDNELHEPTSSPTATAVLPRVPAAKDTEFEPRPIHRHDSGYESIHSGSRFWGSQSSNRRSSTISLTSSSQSRLRKHLPIERAHKSTSSHLGRFSEQQLHLTVSRQQQQQTYAYFYFPAPEAMAETLSDDGVIHEVEQTYTAPPQTTHYWTSDRTRRLEYAAIDAASKGIRGWFLRRIPNRFVPKENRRLRFDDDTGSVRRYRLDIDYDESGGKDSSSRDRKKKGWLLGR
ncbi:hypothetical protein F5X99DRAFT_403572 [Biscogniauxia marginata]|nr:hypothetical protein F5X99DRAFT_403572 [Biscogniauxia marginata]